MGIPRQINTLIFTLLALIAFAANSIIGRLALFDAAIDPATYTSIRLLSGAVALFAIHMFMSKRGAQSKNTGKGSWLGGLLLFIYAITFSFAYISLSTGTGALVLFGVTQLTLIVFSLASGARLHILEWVGALVAFAGFVYLILPGVSAPSPVGMILMAIAGVAWGGYTLVGRRSRDPLADTSYNFLRTLPFVVVLFFVSINQLNVTAVGVWLAILSGAVTSGIGYTLWYTALPGLSTFQAAVVQLSVPVIAAFGGLWLVHEPITWRLMISSLLVLGGIAMVVLAKNRVTR